MSRARTPRLSWAVPGGLLVVALSWPAGSGAEPPQLTTPVPAGEEHTAPVPAGAGSESDPAQSPPGTVGPAPAGPSGPVTRPASASQRREAFLAWQQTVAAHVEPLLVHEAGQGQAAPPPRLRARVETRYRAAGSGMPEGQQQQLFLRAASDDLGIPGLSMRVQADLQVRWDGQPDRFRDGEQVWLQLREALLRWSSPANRAVATLGRFRPALRRPGALDGAELAVAAGSSWRVAAFAGFRPDRELALRTDAHTFGLQGTLDRRRPAGLSWQLFTGLQGESAGGELQRQTLTLDSRWTWGRSLLVDQTAAVDLGYRDGTQSDAPWQGPAPTELSLLVRGKASPRTTLQLDARHSEQHLTPGERGGLPPEWVQAFAGISSSRAEGSLEYALSPQLQLRPRLRAQQVESAGLWSAAGGLALVRTLSPVWELTLGADYGWGAQQHLDLETALTGRLSERLTLSGGLHALWVQSLESYLNSFHHLAQLRLQGEPRPGLRLWGGVDTALDHGLGGSPPAAVWYTAQLGAGWAF